MVHASLTSETAVVIKSQEIERTSTDEEEKKDVKSTMDVGSSSEAINMEADEAIIKTTKRNICASNEFEKEEGRDL